MSSSEFSGTLDQRVDVEVAADTADGGGGTIRSWQVERSVWASVQVQSRDETAIAGHVGQRARFTLGLRRDGSFPAQARLRWNGLLLDIVSVTEDPAWPDRWTIVAQRSALP